MKISCLIMIAVLQLIACLSVPGAMGIFPVNAYGILVQRIMAGIILTLVVTYNYKSGSNSAFFTLNRQAVNWIVLSISVAGLIIPFIYQPNHINPGKEDVFRLHWTHTLLIAYFLGSGIYFLLYELTMRGIFLDWVKKRYGLPIGVSFNVLVYACMHLPKSFSEALACIPFGLLLCIATLRTKSILPAMLMHLAIGISLEGTIIYYINSHSKILQP